MIGRRRLLITGGHGRLARVVAPRFVEEGWEVHHPGHRELDITDPTALAAVVEQLHPAVVLNLAAITDVNTCEIRPDAAAAVNGLGVANIAAMCDRTGARLVQLSSDYVFDGELGRDYTETDPVNPISVYGETKLTGELAAGEHATVVRTAWVCGRYGRDAVQWVMDQASEPGRELRFVDDQLGSPTMADDLADMLVLLVSEDLRGTFHVTNQGRGTWYDLARHVLELIGEDPSRVVPITTGELDPPSLARRPARSVLANTALRAAGVPLLRDWREAFSELVHRITVSPEPV